MSSARSEPAPARRATTAVAVVLVTFLATTLAGCGLKGPLYLPAPPPRPVPPAATPAATSPEVAKPADGAVEPKPPR